MATVAATKKAAEQDATKGPNELFKFSVWVHAGQGADECEQAEAGCTDPNHFHAWCRLPNQLQHDDIRERALAHKARRIRMLRDPAADAHEILESDMAELARVASSEDLVQELVNKDWWKRQLQAMGDVEEQEEYKTVDRDRERINELRALEPDKRPEDELAELERHLAAYGKAVEAIRAELEAPVRASLSAMSTTELIEQIREDRIGAEAAAAFMEMYSRWEWLAGTYRSSGPHRKRSFDNINELTESAPEVLEALRAAFAELEGSLQRGARGN